MRSLDRIIRLMANGEPDGCAARTWCSVFLVPVVVVLASLLIAPMGTRANSLDLAIASTELDAAPGGTVVFTGVITNITGTDLDTTELFFNFSGYDPTNLDVNQILGSTIINLPNFTFSPLTDLFSVGVASEAPLGLYSFQVQLEDINNDVSAVETVSVNVEGSSNTVPEPGSAELMLSGLLACCLAGVRRISSK
jgi:hypothetical protein